MHTPDKVFNTGDIVKVKDDDIIGVAEEWDEWNGIWYVHTAEWGIMMILPQDLEATTT